VSVKTLQRWDLEDTLAAHRIHNPESSPQQELVEDLISIIHVSSGRIYGLRKYKKKIEGDTDVSGVQNGNKANGGTKEENQPNHRCRKIH